MTFCSYLPAPKKSGKAKAQEKAARFQKSGQMDKVMTLIQKVQESIEAALTREQRYKIKAL